MDITIFLLCYNESHIIRETIAHYKKQFPNAQFIISDNYSTDNSVEIANLLGCKIIKFDTKNTQDENIMLYIRSNCFTQFDVTNWVIVCDMDEWLCITEDELKKEEENGTTILKTIGYEMIGESILEQLSDINLHSISKGIQNKSMNKSICFNTNYIKDIGYTHGSLTSNPKGMVKYSEKQYIIKHMNMLGLKYFITKNINRYERNEYMRKANFNMHFMNDEVIITKKYNIALQISSDISDQLVPYLIK